MLRLTEIKLPLDHPPEALAAAIAARLGETPIAFEVFRRAPDARFRNAIRLTYTVDVTVADEARHTTLRRTPDTTYRPVTRAEGGKSRPVVIGAGPCGLFAALVLAEMGFRPIVLERG